MLLTQAGASVVLVALWFVLMKTITMLRIFSWTLIPLGRLTQPELELFLAGDARVPTVTSEWVSWLSDGGCTSHLTAFWAPHSWETG